MRDRVIAGSAVAIAGLAVADMGGGRAHHATRDDDCYRIDDQGFHGIDHSVLAPVHDLRRAHHNRIELG